MTRLKLIATVLCSALLLVACGGEGTPTGNQGGNAATANRPANTSGSVSPGASGIKDPALLGKWITADGGSGYDFKDDFSVVVTMVGSEIQSAYNIIEGGNGQGKVEIGEQSGVIVWTYKIDGGRMDLTAEGGRAKKLTKTQ
ncbi:MAG: hypothetical protein RMN25_13110 [Anaerolineae bacterium]|nr:hypothetical protein [Thermoflexales bacterium]MDW8408712.1 hypothetical protein [Anaerolineae bacterium]